MTAINHSSPTRKHRRRRKRKSTTNRYWRRDNHKIQLDTNAVINLNTVTLTHVETQSLAAVSPFVVLHVTLTGLKLELISMNLADVWDSSNTFMTILLKPIPTHSVPKAAWPLHPTGTLIVTLFLDAVEHDLFNVTSTHVRDNLTARERHGCKLLSRWSDIVLKSADKGSGTVVMDREWHINECLRQLNDTKFYKTLDNDIQKRIRMYAERLHREKIIADDTKGFLIQTDPEPGRF